MSDTPLVPVTPSEAATAVANGHAVYSITQEFSTVDWNTPVVPPVVTPPVTTPPVVTPPVVTPPTPVPSLLPFGIGTNGAMVDYGADTAGLACAQGIGMTWWREEIPWNFTKPSGRTGIEVTAGTYLQSTFDEAVTVANAIKASGMKPLFVVTVNNNPGLSATWTSGPPCTPQQLSDAMVKLVTYPGLQGLDWEVLNEPDGSQWGVPPALLVEAYSLFYPAMKAADPTCTVHGFVLEAIAPAGYGGGTDYYDKLVVPTAQFPQGILPFMDQASFHLYFPNSSWTAGDISPDSASGALNMTGVQAIGSFQKHRLSKGDTHKMSISEFGWQNSGDGAMTPALQAQYYGTFLKELAGNDPINNVAFSSYLSMMIQFAMHDSGAHWGILGQPAVATLTALVKG